MSITKLTLGGNNLIITGQGEFGILGTGKPRKPLIFFTVQNKVFMVRWCKKNNRAHIEYWLHNVIFYSPLISDKFSEDQRERENEGEGRARDREMAKERRGEWRGKEEWKAIEKRGHPCGAKKREEDKAWQAVKSSFSLRHRKVSSRASVPAQHITTGGVNPPFNPMTMDYFNHKNVYFPSRLSCAGAWLDTLG
jgi:hypothetical protein